jgi:hypothetical protein
MRHGESLAVPLKHFTELDALVGRYITCETPRTYWQDALAFFRFDSLDEAVRVLQQPCYQSFITQLEWETSAVRMVETYRRYSTDANAAWEVVERLSVSPNFALKLTREDRCWRASFHPDSEAEHEIATVAICLAALRARGITAICASDLRPDNA